MKIFFKNIIGLDSNLVWEYDEATNYATCLSTIHTLETEETRTFKLPEGMLMDDGFLVVPDVKSFKQNYPFTKAAQNEEENQSSKNIALIKCSLFPPINSSESRSPSESSTPTNSNSNLNDKIHRHSTKLALKNTTSTLSAGDYPSSIQLNDLINDIHNQKFAGLTIAYYSLINKRNSNIERKALYLKTLKSFTHPPESLHHLYKSKIDILNAIKKLLILFNDEYKYFDKINKHSHLVRKEITDYFAYAIQQTMANGEFRKRLTESQCIPSVEIGSLFNNNPWALELFNKQIFQIKLETLTFNWLALIDNNFKLESSIAGTFDTETLKALSNFKSYLQENDSNLKLKSQITLVTETLAKLIKLEEEQDAIVKNYLIAHQNIDEMIDGFYSLKALLTNLIKPIMKPIIFDLHEATLKEIVFSIFKNLISKLSKDPEFTDKNYGNFIADINIYDSNDLYISPEWLPKIESCLIQISKDKAFPKKESLHAGSSSLSKFISLFDMKIYECLKSLLNGAVISEKDLENSSPANSIKMF
ncbi:MAG: hypothetical protein H0U57_01400 [Tatlockia sp.]|nr:hypothetical protein [Tatlockia sp.]